jgi:hypothetical protein
MTVRLGVGRNWTHCMHRLSIATNWTNITNLDGRSILFLLQCASIAVSTRVRSPCPVHPTSFCVLVESQLLYLRGSRRPWLPSWLVVTADLNSVVVVVTNEETWTFQFDRYMPA